MKIGDYICGGNSGIEEKYERIKEGEIIIGNQQYGVILRSYKNGVMKFPLYCKIEEIEEEEIESETESRYNDNLLKIIVQNRVIACSDASVKRQYMRIVQTVCDLAGKNTEDSKGWSNKWQDNTNIVGEAIELYQLLLDIRDNTKHLESRLINIFNNCSKVMNKIAAGFIKAIDGI